MCLPIQDGVRPGTGDIIQRTGAPGGHFTGITITGIIFTGNIITTVVTAIATTIVSQDGETAIMAAAIVPAHLISRIDSGRALIEIHTAGPG